MIGDAYFDLRTRLDSALHALEAVLREVGADAEGAAIVENLLSSLKEPFVFVVVGEVNVGKSTFLNALFGQEFSRTGVMPTTGKILFFKHGPVHQVTPLTPTLDEVQVPAEFLKDFHIVDTPGTNSVEQAHQEITERFVPIADLVIFVFSAMNPWGASAWQFLDKVHSLWLRNVVFVLQQCDLRTPEEIRVIMDYMGQLCRQRYGREFPVFPVSAKKAYEARTAGVFREQMLLESGLPPVEQYVSSLVTQDNARLQKLVSTTHIARQLLRHLQERITLTSRHAQHAAALVQELQTERELQVDRTLKKVLPALDATERDYQESCVWVASLAEEVLATRHAFEKSSPEEEEELRLRPGGNKLQSLDHRLFQDLQQRTGDRWRQVGVILEEDFLQYDRFLHHQGRGSLFPADVRLPTETDPEIRRLFGAHIDSTIRRLVLELKLDETVAPGLLAARKRARWVPWLALPMALLIGGAWYLEGPVGGAIASAVGFVVIGIAFLVTQAALSRTRRQLTERMESFAAPLREMLQEQVRLDVESLFERFAPLLAPALSNALQREQQMNQQMQRLEAMAAMFKDLEREIRN